MANGDDAGQSQTYAGAESLGVGGCVSVVQALPSLHGYVDDVHHENAGVDGFAHRVRAIARLLCF